MKKFLNLMITAILAVTIFSCSNNEDVENTSAKALYENVVTIMYNADNKLPAFAQTETDGVYIAVAEKVNVAVKFAEKVINKKLDGLTTDVNLNEYGTLKVINKIYDSEKEPDSEGVYIQLIVNVKDYIPYTLLIIDKERANNDNGYTGTGIVIDVAELLD